MVGYFGHRISRIVLAAGQASLCRGLDGGGQEGGDFAIDDTQNDAVIFHLGGNARQGPRGRVENLDDDVTKAEGLSFHRLVHGGAGSEYRVCPRAADGGGVHKGRVQQAMEAVSGQPSDQPAAGGDGLVDTVIFAEGVDPFTPDRLSDVDDSVGGVWMD